MLTGFMVFSQAVFADDTTVAEGSIANTEVTDETLVVCLASEPSTLWGAPDGKVENECQIINSAHSVHKEVTVMESGKYTVCYTGEEITVFFLFELKFLGKGPAPPFNSDGLCVRSSEVELCFSIVEYLYAFSVLFILDTGHPSFAGDPHRSLSERTEEKNVLIKSLIVQYLFLGHVSFSP